MARRSCCEDYRGLGVLHDVLYWGTVEYGFIVDLAVLLVDADDDFASLTL